MTQTPVSYDLGPDFERDWTPWSGDPDVVVVAQEEDGVVITGGPDPTDAGQRAVLWSRLAVSPPWSLRFYYTNLGTDPVDAPVDTGASLYWGYRVVLPGYPVAPGLWSPDQYRDPSLRPFVTDATLARVGDGIEILFDLVRGDGPGRDGTAQGVSLEGGGSLRTIDVQPFSLTPGLEYLMTLIVTGDRLLLRKEGLGEPTQTLLLADSSILAAQAGWIGLGLSNAREARFRALARQTIAASDATGGGAATVPPPPPPVDSSRRLPYRTDEEVRGALPWATGVHVADGQEDVQDWVTNQGAASTGVLSFDIDEGLDSRGWAGLVAGPDPSPGGPLDWAVRNRVPLALGIPPWPADLPVGGDPSPNLLALVQGDYDVQHRQWARRLLATGAFVATVRPMWSADAGMPWSLSALDPGRSFSDRKGVLYDYLGLWKAAFRKLAGLYRESVPFVRVEFHCSGDFGTGVDARFDDLFPGAEHADIISTTFLGDDSRVETESGIDDLFAAGSADLPSGPPSWMACARAHALPLGVTGWRLVADPDGVPVEIDDEIFQLPRDSTAWIRRMFGFFRDNAPDLAYETYGNRADVIGDSRLWPRDSSPTAGLQYRTLWMPL